MSPKVTVIDYGIGNLHSVQKALRHEGADVTLSAEPAVVRAAERLLLPGVGAFGDGMRELKARGLVQPILDAVGQGTPFLGICLGMQLLLSESEEFGRHEGLGLIPGKVVLLTPQAGFKVPHIGWNRLTPPPGRDWKGSVLEDVAPGTATYFVHSYSAVPEQEAHRLADVDYGGFRISAAVKKGNITGCQFHPEKSGPVGLQILKRFLAQAR